MQNFKNYELYHYGLDGMKWGRRRWQYYDGRFNEAGKERYFGKSSSHRPKSVRELQSSGSDLDDKKRKMREARRAYNKAFNKADNLALAAYSPIKKHRLANAARWNDVYEKKALYEQSKSEYKAAKKAAEESLDKYGSRKVNYEDEGPTYRKKDEKGILGLSQEESERAKKIAKIVGISMATTAGVLAVGYLMQRAKNDPNFSELLENGTSSQVLEGINSDRNHEHSPFALGSELLNNPYNGDYVGVRAALNGYGPIDKEFISNAIESINKGDISYSDLIQNVRVNQVDGTFFGANRRLSCWSTANAYFMSAMTGHNFASKSFSNLVDFNDFGKLYNTMPEIFNLFGKKADDFVGDFGSAQARVSVSDTKSLVTNIFKNISSKNNVTADGSRTIGFINAGYHGMTCTHEWNFEVFHGMDGKKNLTISDGYSGERYHVAKMRDDGKVVYTDGFQKFIQEMRHYNASSVRFYAPSLDSINREMMSQIILGKD